MAAPAVGRRIGVASLIWMVALLLSRVTGLLRDAVLGHTLGAGAQADAYAAAFRIPDNVTYVISGGALSIVFIPMFSAFLARGEEERGWRAFSLVANFVLVLALVLGTLAWIFTPELARLVAPDFDAEQMALLIRLTRIVMPAQVFHLLSGLLGAALLARDKHGLPALAPLLYNVGIIVGGLVTGTAEGFAWGVLFGAIVGPFLVPLIGCLRVGLKWRPVLDVRDRDFVAYLKPALPIMLAFSITGFDDTVWTHFGSAEPGTVALLNYAKTLMKVPLGVFGMAMGQAAYPTLARLAAQGKTDEVYTTVVRATRLTLMLAFASQVALTVAGPEAGTIVYGTARIAPAQMAELGLALGIFSAALGSWSAQTLLARGFYAMGQTWVPTTLGFGVLALSLPIYAALGDRFGGPGLAAASSIGVTIYVVALEALLRRRIGSGPGYGGFLLRIGVATALAIGAGWALRSAMGPPAWTRLDALVRAAVLVAVAEGVFLGACTVLRVPETREVVERVLRRLRKRP